MTFGLNTVRRKLTALVAFSAIVTLAVLPVLSAITDRQLIAQVHERVPGAVRAFSLELDGDLGDLQTIVLELASERDVASALRSGVGGNVEALGTIFHGSYPRMDLLFFGADGKRIAQIAIDAPPDDVGAIPELLNLRDGQMFRGVVEHGCERGESAPPGILVAKRIAGAGTVVSCLPLDSDYLSEMQQKLGVELAFTAPTSRTPFVRTRNFPTERAAEAPGDGTPSAPVGKSAWSLQRVMPESMRGARGSYGAIVALDVADIRGLLRRQLTIALAVLSAATLVSFVLGARLASGMSRALGRVSAAFQKLRNQEYSHVDIVRTGDELEDLAAGFNAMIDGLKERDKLRNTFGKYMTRTVMDHLMSGTVQLGGETLTVTILFSDIRSFTSISEKMNDAQALVGLLNEYFTEMVGIIMEEDGVVDKYIGDAIMAVFGAPVSKPDDAVRAVRAAVRMRSSLAELNERLARRGIPALRTGIGIHTGEVVAGNIGSEQRMEYTVIGDAVNLASRLETSTKEAGVDILVSAATYALVDHMCQADAVGDIAVKGRAEPVRAYAVRGLAPAPLLNALP